MQGILKPELNFYELTELIGEGLSSFVYRAVRTDSRKHSSQVVALKILKSQKHVNLLKNEFAALSQIKSDYCVSVLGWENFEKSSALVLEFVEGISLDKLLKLGQVTSDALDEITRQVQLGLAHLCAQNLCHGDLSPSNILIDRKGSVKLVDFGLANWSASENFGTPDFLSPERWKGAAPHYFSDLYALGLIRRYINEEAECGKLLALQPYERFSLNVPENKFVRIELGRMVSQILDQVLTRRVITEVLQTVALQKPVLSRSIKRWTSVAVSILFFAIVLFPFSPHTRQATVVIPAELEIRSQSWIHATIGTADLGYTPIRVRAIYPGHYRIKWRTFRSQGVKEISLNMGEHKMLTEADFQVKSR